MSDEPTKACIVMLKFESKIWKIIKYPLMFIIKCVNFILQFINWCIIGSLLRLFGIPLAVYGIWKLINLVPADPFDNVIIGYVFLVAFSIVGFMFSWVEMPSNQKKIIFGDES